jgi:hypothetical protein
MAISFDAASGGPYHLAGSTLSWSHTVGAGQNRILFVGVALFAVGTVSGVTLGAQNFTFLRADAVSNYRSEIWYLVAPTSGVGTITVTLSASLASTALAASYAGVDPAIPLEGSNGNVRSGLATSATVGVTSTSDNDWIFDVVSAQTTSGVTASQTQRAQNNGTNGTIGISDTGPISPPATTTMTWTGIGSTDLWAISGVAMIPAGGVSSNAFFTMGHGDAGRTTGVFTIGMHD